MSEKLKPCPFCGKRGHYMLTKKTRGSQSGEPLQYHYVACRSPHCPMFTATKIFVVKEHAGQAWNTRTESEESKKLKSEHKLLLTSWALLKAENEAFIKEKADKKKAIDEESDFYDKIGYGE